ncbi:hypothetical protein V8F33_004102 [Rhypophila sp. PSN 637]|uniref:Invertebrate defensins family profile domain-containing protein n=1 Tax=Rhypophila decipiens TaxID=261697 RepID=A0AAN6Y6H2_9PEZI|nr:hypothetical protein QBC37DRAFT_424428 [Rhypophila decipiens]
MKFAMVIALASALGAVASPAPSTNKIERRDSCQYCDVWVLNAGDACCSLHCNILGNVHGGHCNKNRVCICN